MLNSNLFPKILKRLSAALVALLLGAPAFGAGTIPHTMGRKLLTFLIALAAMQRLSLLALTRRP
jgi:hypothetical protein